MGFNGNKIVKTPNLDGLAAQGVVLSRFYSASAVCSPTRGSVMTGRNPNRIGIPNANEGHLDKNEITLAEVLKDKGYTTGHFGKWHLGTFTTTEKDANRGGTPQNDKHFTVPSDHGYQDYLATESKVPTYNPMAKPKKFEQGESLRDGWNARTDEQETEAYGTFYWTLNNQKVSKALDGDDSKIIMDRVIKFIDQSKQQKNLSFQLFGFIHHIYRLQLTKPGAICIRV
ncbi:sulfatase-like hydrolase/transferase [Niabella ginsengisoli]|uniref:Sulfatase-like hydrolase/transferase n=1 Tax=Niabella ginsengisoli TaxID=522298 RepID=A0ABS9SGL7_9BACT|nr:sulfatase-like hydrolase/transferase [Niabella ginsengisoli]MCH5597503.1 sulfatase-like hydrolase/transferase [Niabella ginsengisoli]